MIQKFLNTTDDGHFLPLIYYRNNGKGFIDGRICSSKEKAENLSKRMAVDAITLMLRHYVNHREKVFSLTPHYNHGSVQTSINFIRAIIEEKLSEERLCERIWNARYHVRNIKPGQSSKFYTHQSEFVESLINFCFTEVQKQKKNDSINI